MNDELMKGMQEVRASFERELADASTTEALEEVRVRCMGKKGALTALLRSLGKLSPEERPAAGQDLNALRDEMEEKLSSRKRQLRDAENEAQEAGERICTTEVA